jgi:hypothetical protein
MTFYYSSLSKFSIVPFYYYLFEGYDIGLLNQLGYVLLKFEGKPYSVSSVYEFHKLVYYFCWKHSSNIYFSLGIC